MQEEKRYIGKKAIYKTYFADTTRGWFLNLNPIQDGPFEGCSQMDPLLYLKKIQKTYKPRDTTLQFC